MYLFFIMPTNHLPNPGVATQYSQLDFLLRKNVN